ncbi:Protein SPA2 [Pseudocercospora fuligena]|uniref:Protein SPA2 n=1 Tax=Pseudocercospora fuligena TaxID=685502 RepID=A0A8H6VLH7_9PEZI|nr:Protein SPA2 [Pseudocercospora fuligena]
MSRAVGTASPLSPLSMSSNESSFVGRYGGNGSVSGPAGSLGGTLNDAPYNGGPYGAARPPQTSPPSSQHPSGSTDMSRPSASGSSNRPPSSASSVGMSSDGRMGFAKPPNRDSSRSQIPPNADDALSRHYATLREYLADSLQDEKGNLKPNRARDKLLRLSVTQFMELSTDVYDELIRREDDRAGQIPNVPRFLLPKQNFHPKRNQARQKLSTLPTERFRQLATDVFYELERRIPRFAGGDIPRPRSTASNASSRSRAPSRGGMRPPPGPNGYPFPPGAGRGGPPRGPMSPYGPGPNGMPPGPRRPSEAASLGRPLPKHFQSNTIVPNKSTMVEDDDMEDDEDAFGLDHVGSGLSERHSRSTSAEDKERMHAQEAEIAELKEKVESLEAKLTEASEEAARTGTLDAEREQWTAQREELEQKHMDAQSHNTTLQRELDVLKSKVQDTDTDRDQHEQNVRDMREQLDDVQEQLAEKHDENAQLQLQLRTASQDKAELQQLQGEIEELRRQLQANSSRDVSEDQIVQLREQLAKQEKINMQVREEAMQNLREMRELSRQNDEAIEQEEKMAAKIAKLEKENDTWRQRYAKVKAQNKHLRASTMGLGLSTGLDTGSLVRQEGLISEGGLVRDTEVTRFQLAVDELLKVARGNSTDAMLESVKSVVVSVQSITSAVRTDGYPSPGPSPSVPDMNMQSAPPSVGKIQARVTGTANSLITATKQHAASHGLSPVALLDAAASNLTSAVVELIKAVKIRPSTKNELADMEDADELHSFYDDSLSPTGNKTLQIPVPQLTPASSSSPSAAEAAALSSSAKKANTGWFGWAGKWGDGSHEDAPQQSTPQITKNGNGVHHHHSDSLDSGSDYDPYR